MGGMGGTGVIGGDVMARRLDVSGSGGGWEPKRSEPDVAQTLQAQASQMKASQFLSPQQPPVRTRGATDSGAVHTANRAADPVADPVAGADPVADPAFGGSGRRPRSVQQTPGDSLSAVRPSGVKRRKLSQHFPQNSQHQHSSVEAPAQGSSSSSSAAAPLPPVPTPDSLLAREGSSDGRRVRRRLRGKANHNCFHLGCSHVTEAETSSLRLSRENVGPEAASLRRSGEGVGLEVASLGRSRENDGLAAESLSLSRENVGLEVASLGLSRENVGRAAAALRLSRENVGLEAVGVGVPSLAARRLDVGGRGGMGGMGGMGGTGVISGSGGGWEPKRSEPDDAQTLQAQASQMKHKRSRSEAEQSLALEHPAVWTRRWTRRLELWRGRRGSTNSATSRMQGE